jgi:P-type Cu2+ transporter
LENLSDTTCHLCGLPAGSSNISQPVAGRTVQFCCLGCMVVFQILYNSPGGIPGDYQNTELYKACVSAGLIPSGEAASKNTPLPRLDPALPNVAPPPPKASGESGLAIPAGGPTAPLPGAGGEFGLANLAGGPTAIEEGLSQELSIRVEGMWCVACSWLIEHLVRKMDGVLSAGIFFFSDIARIKYMPHLVQPETIMESISRLGYKASAVESPPDSGQSRNLIVRLGISAILSMNIMMISFALWAGFFEQIGQEGAALFSYTLWVMASPVVFYAGWPILRKAFGGIRHFSATMDTLIAVSVLSAYFYSVVATLRGSLYVYFDTASMLVTLVLLGRFIETRAKEKISGTITALFHAASGKARILKDGRQIWTASDKVSRGDLFMVFPGERLPVDGCILSGEAVLDESVITGESRPIIKGPGSEVSAGSLVLNGEAKFEAVRAGGESSLSQLIALIQEALSTKNRYEMFADRLMRVLVPAVLALSACILIFLLASSTPAGEAVLRALTVLVITCPCALGIATPLARVAAIARARASGILIRNPTALERADRLDVMIFDKTGTLTEGSYILRETITLDANADEALLRVASAEVKSDHFLAREIVKAARLRSMELEEVVSFEAWEGLGIIALTRAGEVIAGSRRLMLHHGLEFSDVLLGRANAFETAGSTIVFFAWNGAVRGFFVFGDRLRDNAPEIVSRLRAEGISVWIVSGDSEQTTRTFAIEAGADNFAGQKGPQDKVRIIEDFQAQGKRVAMAGDGINDAAALARADIGITLGAGANLIRECSDAAVLGDDLLKIPELLELSRFSFKITRQNLFFSFFYNLLGIPLAAAGILNPLIAAFAMFASSVSVILNTSRISRFTGRVIKKGSPG